MHPPVARIEYHGSDCSDQNKHEHNFGTDELRITEDCILIRMLGLSEENLSHSTLWECRSVFFGLPFPRSIVEGGGVKIGGEEMIESLAVVRRLA